MEYLTVHDISKKWGMKERKITGLCRNGRIAGVRKNGKIWMIPSDAIIPLDMRTREFEHYVKDIQEFSTTTSYTTLGASDKVVDSFKEIYHKEPMYTTFTPYIVCPIGAHVDHNLGKAFSFAIDKGIHIAYNIKQNGIIEIISLQFPKRAQWHVLETPINCEMDWADNLRGATIALNKRYPLRFGLSAVMDGELPIGGASSSAAMIISFINALAFLNHISLTKEELIEIANEADTKYVGVFNGKLNLYSELYSEKDKLLYIDMKDNSYELISTPNGVHYHIGIFFSGVDNTITSNMYNSRVDELRCSSYMIKAFLGCQSHKFIDSNMRDVSYEDFLKYKDRLPKSFVLRCEHFYEECMRVEEGVSSYQSGDLEKFGKLISESGYSSIHKWETGTKELVSLYELLENCDGVYGTRFSGSGFKGCCIAIMDPKKENNIMRYVEEEYLKVYPELKMKYSSHICYTADGIKL